jgi:catechol 2,3-dioxygenase-like lactoylglutathione lyase family enzyme
MKIKLTSVFVDDQEKALKFYTGVLGFATKMDFTAGKYRWLTVVSPEEPDGTQLQLAAISQAC